jgi:hypothetical protein
MYCGCEMVAKQRWRAHPHLTKFAIAGCDICQRDWRDRVEAGGLFYADQAVCPDCAPMIWERIRRLGEEHMVEGWPMAGESFADACRRRWRVLTPKVET